MKDNPSDDLSSIPPALINWIESQHALPSSMMAARTFYEAARSVQNTKWHRKLDRFSAMHTWMTISLIAHDRTRKYMAELIHDDADGLHWAVRTGSATRAALDDLDRPNSSSPGRLFKQQRDAAIKGLRMARENLAALDTFFSIRDLIKAPELQKFRDTVQQFTHASFSRRRNAADRARAQAVASGASAGEVMRASFSGFLVAGDQVPDLSYLLPPDVPARGLQPGSVGHWKDEQDRRER